MLFEIQRHLLVGDLAPQRPHEEPADRREQRHEERNAGDDDGRWGEPRPVQSVRRDQQQNESDSRDADDTAEGELHPPAGPGLLDDVEQRSWR
jgi:hypothetical protein